MRIFRRSPKLSELHQRIDFGNQKLFIDQIRNICNKRFMNIDKMEKAIFDRLFVGEIDEQTHALAQFIQYLYHVPRGSEIGHDMFVAGIRAIQQVEVSEALVLGEIVSETIFAVAAFRRMISLYLLENDIERASQLLEKLPKSNWNERTTKRIESIKKLNQGLLDEESGQSEHYNIIKPVERPPVFGKITMACLFDRFTYDCLAKEINLLSVSKSNWKSILSRPEINYFFAESIWSGHDGGWKFAMSSFNTAAGNQLRKMLEYCKENNIVTIFWNKEDPVNYDSFIDVAKNFDYIFTSDKDTILRYIEDCGHERIFPLSFAAQPLIHNPIRNALPLDDVCFAGSWYVREHGNRKRDTKLLVDAASKFDLHIFDRFHGTENRNRFPKKYGHLVKGSLTYKETCMAYRAFKVFLNVNSVDKSPSMFSRRVFEILASSTALLSTPSKGMESMLGNCISIASNLEEAEEKLSKLLNDHRYREIAAHLGYRNVMNNHTYTHRINYLLDKIGHKTLQEKQPLVSCITCSNRPNMFENIMNNFDNQKHANKELILLMQGSDDEYHKIGEKLEGRDNIILLRQLEEELLGAVFNRGVDASSGDYIAKFDDDDKYGPHYIDDGLLPFNFTSASVVGKCETFLYHEATNRYYLRFPGKRHRYLDFVMGATIIAKREVFDEVRFGESNTGEDSEFLRQCNKKGYKIYSSDPYNWIHMRHESKNFHTWQIEDAKLLKPAILLEEDVNVYSDIFIDDFTIKKSPLDELSQNNLKFTNAILNSILYLKENKSDVRNKIISILDSKTESKKFSFPDGLYTPKTYQLYSRIEEINENDLDNKIVIKPLWGHTGNGVLLLEKRKSKWFENSRCEEYSWKEVCDIFQKEKSVASNHVMLEELLEDRNPKFKIPFDYKMHVFYGKVELITQRNVNPGPNSKLWESKFYDRNWNYLDNAANNTKTNADLPVPELSSQLVNFAEEISSKIPMPFIRIDLYETTKGVAFGEFTFHPGNHWLFKDKVQKKLGQAYTDAIERIGNYREKAEYLFKSLK